MKSLRYSFIIFFILDFLNQSIQAQELSQKQLLNLLPEKISKLITQSNTKTEIEKI